MGFIRQAAVLQAPFAVTQDWNTIVGSGRVRGTAGGFMVSTGADPFAKGA